MKALIKLCAVLALGLLALQACERTQPSLKEEKAIRNTVEAYLHALAKSYSSMSVEPIKELASAREIEDVRGLLHGLLGTGDRLEARLLSVEFMTVTIFREINATVTTEEVWDVARYDSNNGKEKGRNPASVQTSILQLRLIEGKWRVLARRVLETQGGSKWKVEEGLKQGEDGAMNLDGPVISPADPSDADGDSS